MSGVEQKVSMDEFVKAVCAAAKAGQGAEEVAEATGLTPGTVVNKLSKLNTRLVAAGKKKLPALARKAGAGRPGIDIEALNSLIEESR